MATYRLRVWPPWGGHRTMTYTFDATDTQESVCMAVVRVKDLAGQEYTPYRHMCWTLDRLTDDEARWVSVTARAWLTRHGSLRRGRHG